MSRHQFALYIYDVTALLQALPSHGRLCISSKDIHHRITRVLRLQSGDSLILFDRTVHVVASIDRIAPRDEIDFVVGSAQKNNLYAPSITVALPLLKREALESAVYGLTEVGVTTIQLITTEKGQQRWQGEKEYDRLQRIIIAAAEQAKNFALPVLFEPISLKDFIDVQRTFKNNKTIFFEPTGTAAAKLIPSLSCDIQQFTLLIGPEADLSEHEKQLLAKADVTFCSLTPTILRAQQAAILGAAMFRILR